METCLHDEQKQRRSNSLTVIPINRAGCKSDREDQYNSQVESSQLMSGVGPDHSDTLTMCVQSAKDEYDSCIAECDS